MNISQNKLLKPLSVHKYTHQMQTHCERKKNRGTVPLSEQEQCQECEKATTTRKNTFKGSYNSYKYFPCWNGIV